MKSARKPPEQRVALAVTTAWDDTGPLERRALEVSEHTGAPFFPRHRSLSRIRRDAGANLVYVVGREREELRDGARCAFVHAGMLSPKRGHGARHPFVRAVAPEGGGAVRRIADATMGLGGDALHLAGTLGAEVVGFEASPVVRELLGDGLARLSRRRGLIGDAARRVRVAASAAEEGLSELERTGGIDVVLFDPMFAKPKAASPGYELFRAVAVSRPIDDATFAIAARAASRVVLKLPRDAPAPPLFASARRVRGKAIDYLALERGDVKST